MEQEVEIEISMDGHSKAGSLHGFDKGFSNECEVHVETFVLALDDFKSVSSVL